MATWPLILVSHIKEQAVHCLKVSQLRNLPLELNKNILFRCESFKLHRVSHYKRPSKLYRCIKDIQRKGANCISKGFVSKQ